MRPTLLRFCKSKIWSFSDAEDVAQNVILILIQKQKEYDPNKSFYSWAMNICRFQIMAYLKTIKRNREYNVSSLNADASPASKNTKESECSPDSLGYFFNKMPFQNLIQDEKEKVFEQIKSTLSQKEKTIMDLSLQGWGINDITYRLKISRNAFTTCKSRALKKAKNFFKNKHIDGYKL